MGEFSPPRLSIVAPTDVPDQNQIHLTAERKLIVERRSEITAAGNNRSLDGKPDIVEGFLRLAALPTFPLDRLSRYENVLWRQARQIVITLEFCGVASENCTAHILRLIILDVLNGNSIDK